MPKGYQDSLIQMKHGLQEREEIRLGTFERKVLRRIYGPCLDTGTKEWRIRTNEEVYNLFQRPIISKEVTKRRLVWAGHAWRKKDAMINTAIKEEPKGKRPRLRWEDCGERSKRSRPKSKPERSS